MSSGKICRRCLLDEIDEDDFIRSIKEYIADYPAEKRAEQSVYKNRLALCAQCGCLVNGMCAKCGCYAELRALKKNQHCPDVPCKW